MRHVGSEGMRYRYSHVAALGKAAASQRFFKSLIIRVRVSTGVGGFGMIDCGVVSTRSDQCLLGLSASI
jgi:hypothetical protein